jgi:hypothetical protein
MILSLPLYAVKTPLVRYCPVISHDLFSGI